MFADPRTNVRQFGLQPGMTVADFGAGGGALALEMAKLIRPNGKVVAIDVQQALLARLKSEARAQGLNNVEVVWGDVEKRGGSKLADRSVDAVIISNLLFQSAAAYSLALEAKRILKPGGQAVVVEWSGSFGGLGPVADAVVAPERAKQIFNEAGFASPTEFAAGAQHYGLIFKAT